MTGTGTGNTATRPGTIGRPGTTTPTGYDRRGRCLGELIKSPDGVPAELHQTTWCAEKTIDFISEAT